VKDLQYLFFSFFLFFLLSIEISLLLSQQFQDHWVTGRCQSKEYILVEKKSEKIRKSEKKKEDTKTVGTIKKLGDLLTICHAKAACSITLSMIAFKYNIIK
jgi:hypothetical protein